jgi:signal transduction histidine kinase/ActR/RegA family two-component response regulator
VNPPAREVTVADESPSITAGRRTGGPKLEIVGSPEAELRALFDESAVPSWVCDAETLRILAVNKAALERAGYERREMLERDLNEVLTVSGLSAELRTKNGERSTVRVSMAPVRFGGRGARLVQIFTRVGSPEAEEDLMARVVQAEKQRAEAENANRAKDEFLAMLSHELRAPLGSILIWTQLLRTGGLDEAATVRALGMIERSTETLEHFIEDLLDISRIIAGKLSLEVRPTDVASVVEAAVEEAQPAAKAKSIRLSCELDRDLPPTSGDHARLQQVVRNLLANAIKFTPEGGTVDVRLDNLEARARIRVTDTGVGIPQDYLSSVFERFRQLDSTSSRAHRGLGLGLAIVRHLVELHGGSVTADSPGQGQGSTFTVLLPLVSALVEAPIHVEPLPPPPGTLDEHALDGIRVLLVDDEEDARESLRVLLERSGAEVAAVRSAADALACIEEFRPHVLLSDIAMPEEDGYRLIHKVRALDPGRGGATPAAALTAYASREDRRSALLAGYQDHVAKPPDPPRLIALLARLARTADDKSQVG